MPGAGRVIAKKSPGMIKPGKQDGTAEEIRSWAAFFIEGNAMEEMKIEALKAIEGAKDSAALEEIRVAYLSKKGKVQSLFAAIRDVPPEERASYGAKANEVRSAIEAAYQNKKKELDSKALDEKLKGEAIDLSFPGYSLSRGHRHPYHLIIDEVIDIFAGLGFEIKEGRDVETEEYNFTRLNVPHDHPARDMQDTFYLNDGSLLLRTQTSAEQAHAMVENAEKTPLRMICPGKTYRRDDDDMTHSHQFGQIEGLVIDKGISLSDLKGTLALFVRKMFGEKRKIRFRSSYFPFTEPSVEVDVSCSKCGGKGCAMCKGTGYIEILGAGEVHPKVLEDGGYDPNLYSGFAFGIGIERVAMLRYGIDDIRRFYMNDVRFLKAF